MIELSQEEITHILERRQNMAYDRGYNQAIGEAINIIGGMDTASKDEIRAKIALLREFLKR